MNRSESRPAPTLPPVTLDPEEAAAVAAALAARPDGPYSDAGRGALEKILEVLEPDLRRRADLLALTGLGAPPSTGHPAGRKLGRTPPATPTTPPRLTVLPGGRA